jgi:ADP-ribose diphosphatase
MAETILSSHRVFTGRIFGLDTCEVRLPNGGRAYREVIRHSGAAAIIAVDSQKRILLVRQYRVASDQVMSEIPAGLLDEEENPEQCAIRELQEETGYRPGRLESLGGFYTAPGYTSEYIHIFLATELVESHLPQDLDEFIEVQAVTVDQALAMIERGDIMDGKTIVGVLRYANRFAAR